MTELEVIVSQAKEIAELRAALATEKDYSEFVRKSRDAARDELEKLQKETGYAQGA